MFKHFPGLDALRKSQTLVADAMHPVVDDIRTAHLFRVHAKACTVVLHVVTSLLFVFRSPPERSSFIVDEHRIRAQSEIEIVHPHFGQIRAILRLLPQVTSSGDTELAVGCHIAATRGHSCATVPRCLRYRHSKSFTVQPPLPVYGCFRTLRYLQLCCRRYHIYPQGHADFCRYSSVQIPQIPGFGLLHYP